MRLGCLCNLHGSSQSNGCSAKEHNIQHDDEREWNTKSINKRATTCNPAEIKIYVDKLNFSKQTSQNTSDNYEGWDTPSISTKESESQGSARLDVTLRLHLAKGARDIVSQDVHPEESYQPTVVFQSCQTCADHVIPRRQGSYFKQQLCHKEGNRQIHDPNTWYVSQHRKQRICQQR